MSTVLERSGGILEGDVAARSGLRDMYFMSHLVTNQTLLVNAQPIGGAASAAVTSWTALTLAGRTVPFGSTLVAQLIQTSATTGTVRFRVRGVNQFHESIEEITPTISYVAKTNNWIYLAQTFVYINSIEYQSTGLDVAGDTVSIGQRWDWTRTDDATNQHHGGLNLGFAVPLRLAASQVPAAQVGRPFARPLAYQHGGSIDGAMSEINQPSPRARNGLASLGFSNGDTVTIDGKVYTFKVTITAADGDVALGANLIEAITNLRAALMASGGAGTQYGANTVAHPTVRLSATQINDVTSAMGVMARRPGSLGNRIAVSTTSGTSAWFLGGTLLSGVDSPLELHAVTVMDLTGAGSAGSISQPIAEYWLVGYSQAGWSGSLEKVGFVLPGFATQWAITDNIVVSCAVKTAELKS